MLSRRPFRSSAVKEAADEAVAARSASPSAGAKGRPTPKRNANAPSRIATRPPKDRKEAVKIARQRDRATRMRGRSAYLAGDPKALPARDAGPVRAYARDFVDARRSVGEFMMPVLLIALVLSLLPVSAIRLRAVTFVYVLMLIAAGDAILTVRRLKRGLAERFPDQPTKGIAGYAVIRTMQLRRLRTPKPRVKPGTPI